MMWLIGGLLVLSVLSVVEECFLGGCVLELFRQPIFWAWLFAMLGAVLALC